MTIRQPIFTNCQFKVHIRTHSQRMYSKKVTKMGEKEYFKYKNDNKGGFLNYQIDSFFK